MHPSAPDGFAGQASDWLAACRPANIIGNGEDDNARLFFQHLFRPYRLSNSNNGDQGLLTGYYLPRVAWLARHRQAMTCRFIAARRSPMTGILAAW